MRNLISETKVNNPFHVSQFCVTGHSDLTAREREEVYELAKCYVNLLLKNKLKPLLLKIICARLAGYCSVLTTEIFVIYLHI